jgi:hypothetical protein
MEDEESDLRSGYFTSLVTFLVYLYCVQLYVNNSHQNFVGIYYFPNSAYLLSKSHPSTVHYRDNTRWPVITTSF